MAHKKAAGAKAKQGGNVAGKRLGIKVYGGDVVKPGQIIVRQRGQTYLPGHNVGIGKDYIIFLKIDGIVAFVNTIRIRKRIDVVTNS